MLEVLQRTLTAIAVGIAVVLTVITAYNDYCGNYFNADCDALRYLLQRTAKAVETLPKLIATARNRSRNRCIGDCDASQLPTSDGKGASARRPRFNCAAFMLNFIFDFQVIYTHIHTYSRNQN
ncbi:MAG: hypothetical protein H7Z37_13520 [Pyrinomonadaceae bacterium]|nr:hypothetical protein [Pyrinomonadaceae bacterium]